MSGKLDQSLDEILSTQKSVRGRGTRRGRRAPQAGRTTAVIAAPVGGVKKNPKQAKGAVKAIPTGPSGGNGESRIQVSNLVRIYFLDPPKLLILIHSQPKDVNEGQIKVCYR
jgi:THO complex subunit 4